VRDRAQVLEAQVALGEALPAVSKRASTFQCSKGRSISCSHQGASAPCCSASIGLGSLPERIAVRFSWSSASVLRASKS
jgi:hypothetical protein